VVIDERLAWVGGVNVADEYTGDGVTHGWADCGFLVTGAPAGQLAREYDVMLAECDEIQPQSVVARLRRGIRPPAREIGPGIQLLVSGPGRKANAFQKLLRADVAASTTVQFVAAYFLPGFQMRRLLRLVALRGGKVQILVPGKTDVPLARRAARHLYSGLLRSGVEVWEYQPQVLHAKLFLARDAAYVGSSNLDTRSLHINYELMLRLTDPHQVARGREIVAEMMGHARRVDPVTWAASRSWIERWKDQWAYWVLSRVDPYVTRWLAMGPR
jgi:cardiolipin synthase